jgi:hypothetical protein
MMKPGTFRALIRNLRKANEMPTKKTGKTTRTKRKTTATRTAGKTARTSTGLPRANNPKGWAALFNRMEAKRPGWLNEVIRELKFTTAPARTAQVQPREAPEWRRRAEMSGTPAPH